MEKRSNRSIYGRSGIFRKVKPQRWTTMGLGHMGPTLNRPHHWVVEFKSKTPALGRFGKEEGRVPTQTRTPPSRFGRRGGVWVGTRMLSNSAREGLAEPRHPGRLYKGGGGRPRALQALDPRAQTLAAADRRRPPPLPLASCCQSAAATSIADPSSSSTSFLSLSRGALPIFYPDSIGHVEALQDLH
jgi:hypothetical protein